MSLKLPFIEDEIIDQYLYDDNPRPWIIGFSGGKDSTMLLQVVWNALNKISPQTRNRPIYVVCNDTLVENPKIVSRLSTGRSNGCKKQRLNRGYLSPFIALPHGSKIHFG